MVRKATSDDKLQVTALLKQISEQHAAIAPNRYKVATDAFNLAFMERYLSNEKSVVLVAEENSIIIAAAFCIIQENASEGPVKDSLISVLDTIVVAAEH
jgi:hypothetical protein